MRRLERTTFETSRAAEYFDARELQAMTGQPEHKFATVALKELLDNGLDAAEVAGVEPEISIKIRQSSDADEICITVTDNGHGMPPEVVEKVLDFGVRVSDKAAYRSPTRGAQGNALKTVLGIPYALGVAEPVIVQGRGVRHEIRPWVDPAGMLRIEHAKSDAEACETYKSGSAVTLATTREGQDFEPGYWAAAFAMFNPHATITFEHAYDGYAFDETYKRAAGKGFRKYVPTDLTSAHWYSPAAMKRLVFSHIAHAEHSGGRDLPLGEFIRQFKGLSNPSKAKAMRAELGRIEHLSDFAGEPERVAELLAAMQERSKAPNHRVFGRVGPDHFESIFKRAYDVKEFNYQWAKDYTAGGLPYVFEIAVAVTAAPGHLYHGINYTAAFDDPLEGTLLAGPKFKSHGIRGFLQHGHALPEGTGYYSFRAPANVAVAVHLITPAPVFLDRGKTRIQLSEEEDSRGSKKKEDRSVGDVIGETIFKAVKPIYKEGERQRRGAPVRRRYYYEPEPKVSIKDIVFQKLPQAIRNAGYGPSARDLYYAVRPLAYDHRDWPEDKTLSYSYFANTLVVEYERMHGGIPGLWRDPRGHLHEAHPRYSLPLRDPYGNLEAEAERISVPLGTREVDGYDFPPYLFDKILYVEKEGEYPKLLEAKIPERYDMAIVSSKGYATTAVRDLLSRVGRGGDYQIFVFHDADIDGYEIVRTLRSATWRMPHHSIEVIDLGLTIKDALELELDSEPYYRKAGVPFELWTRLTGLEREYFRGRHGERFELNAILPIDRRIEFIREKLEENGVRPKLIPPDGELPELAGKIYRDKHAAWVDEALKELLDLPAIKKALADRFAEEFGLSDARCYIEEAFEEDGSLSWRDALKNKLAAIQEEHADALKKAVGERIAEAVRGGGAQ